MNIAFKKPMKLSEAKQVLREFKTGSVRRIGSDYACLNDSRKRSYTLSFKSNLELKGLVK